MDFLRFPIGRCRYIETIIGATPPWASRNECEAGRYHFPFERASMCHLFPQISSIYRKLPSRIAAESRKGFCILLGRERVVALSSPPHQESGAKHRTREGNSAPPLQHQGVFAKRPDPLRSRCCVRVQETTLTCDSAFPFLHIPEIKKIERAKHGYERRQQPYQYIDEAPPAKIQASPCLLGAFSTDPGFAWTERYRSRTKVESIHAHPPEMPGLYC